MKSSSDSPSKQQREIAIFWDYENVPLPPWCNTTVAAKAIVDAVSKYGRIVDRRLYYDFDKMNRYRPRDCSSLDSSGFDLVNTPTRNMKETLDKKLIADVLTFAWDSAVRNDDCKPCVVLITGDGDYAYTLNKLRDRGIMTIVMVGKGCTVASILVDTADVALALEDDVLRERVSPGANPANAASPKMGKRTISPGSSFVGSRNDAKGMVESLCRFIQEASATSEDGWVDYGQVSSKLQQELRIQEPVDSPENIKEMARKVRYDAEKDGLIEVGRRKLDKTFYGKREIIVSNNPKLNLSKELYVRLLKDARHEDIARSLCRYIQEACATSEDQWIDYGKVSPKLKNRIRMLAKPDAISRDMKDEAKAARQDAENRGLIQFGRRVLDRLVDGKRQIVASNDPHLNLSTEVYVCLLPKGERLIQDESSSSEFKTQSNSRPYAVFMRGMRQDTNVHDLVKYLEDTFHVTVRRALLEDPFHKNVNTALCQGHIEFFNVSDANSLLRQANKAYGGQGVYFGGRYIGVTHDTRAFALDAKGSDSKYYEHARLSKSPAAASPTNVTDKTVDDDTSNDASILCKAIYFETQKGSNAGWINSGAVGMSFRALLSPGYVEIAQKEDINSRYKNARNSAVERGLIEMGRRQIQRNGSGQTYVAVSLIHGGARGGENLSPELYFRLLPPGQGLAAEQEAKVKQPSNSPKAVQQIDLETPPNIFVLLNNLPLSTTASHLAEFLEAALECPAQRIELISSFFKGEGVIDAHVEFTNVENAAKVLSKAKGYPADGLVYCGRHMYATPNHLSPEEVRNEDPPNPDMSYTRETGNRSSSVSPPNQEHLLLNVHETFDSMDTSFIMNQNDTNASKDPFEDLLW